MAIPQAEDVFSGSFKCPRCNGAIPFKISKEKIETSPRFPVSFVSIHGDPRHSLTLYIDRNGKVRGHEVAEILPSLAEEEVFQRACSGLVNQNLEGSAGNISKKALDANFFRIAFQSVLTVFKTSNIEYGRFLRKWGKMLGESMAPLFEEKNLKKTFKKLEDFWEKQNLGRLELVQLSDTIILRVHDCVECGNVPNVGQCVCYFDEGLIEGILQCTTGQDYMVIETKCPANGDEYCEFSISDVGK